MKTMFEYLPLDCLSKETLISIIHIKESEIKSLTAKLEEIQNDHDLSCMSHMKYQYDTILKS